MSQFDDVVEKCATQLKASGGQASEAQLRAIAKGLGPSLYNKDSFLVAASDKAELETIKKNFIAKKLGVTDDAQAQAAIDFSVEKIGSSVRNKMRPVVYALIAENLGKLSQFA